MAFMAAEIIRVIISKRLRPGKEFMLRLWIPLLLAIAAITMFRSFTPLLVFLREELVPHIRHSTLAILNTQPLLFLLLNSIIFAVLAPSGLFSDHHQSSSKSEHTSFCSSFDSTEPVAPAPAESPPPSSDSSGDLKQESVEPPKAMPSERVEVSPPKVRVKRKKSMMQKSHSVHKQQQIAVGIVEGNELPYSKSARNRADSLRDEDFKRLIDSYIAHAREQMIKQDDQASAARSRA